MFDVVVRTPLMTILYSGCPRNQNEVFLKQGSSEDRKARTNMDYGENSGDLSCNAAGNADGQTNSDRPETFGEPGHVEPSKEVFLKLRAAAHILATGAIRAAQARKREAM